MTAPGSGQMRAAREAVLNGELEAISTASMESASDAGMTKATVQSDSGYGTP